MYTETVISYITVILKEEICLVKFSEALPRVALKKFG
jgi:hypothetical protein